MRKIGIWILAKISTSNNLLIKLKLSTQSAEFLLLFHFKYLEAHDTRRKNPVNVLFIKAFIEFSAYGHCFIFFITFYNTLFLIFFFCIFWTEQLQNIFIFWNLSLYSVKMLNAKEKIHLKFYVKNFNHRTHFERLRFVCNLAKSDKLTEFRNLNL